MIENTLIFIVLQLLLLVPSFFLYKKLVRRFNLKKVKLISILLTFIMPFIYVVIFFTVHFWFITPLIRSQKFEKKIWVEDVYSRYKMVTDIIRNGLLIGKTKKEVIDILGEGFHENCWGENTLCYPAYDPDNYAFLDHYELVVFFNEKGTVKRVSTLLI